MRTIRVRSVVVPRHEPFHPVTARPHLIDGWPFLCSVSVVGIVVGHVVSFSVPRCCDWGLIRQRDVGLGRSPVLRDPVRNSGWLELGHVDG